jgi:hypothetical protein
MKLLRFLITGAFAIADVPSLFAMIYTCKATGSEDFRVMEKIGKHLNRSGMIV